MVRYYHGKRLFRRLDETLRNLVDRCSNLGLNGVSGELEMLSEAVLGVGAEQENALKVARLHVRVGYHEREKQMKKAGLPWYV